MQHTNTPATVGAAIESVVGKLRGATAIVADTPLRVMGQLSKTDRTEAYVSVLTSTLSRFRCPENDKLEKAIKVIMQDANQAQLLTAPIMVVVKPQNSTVKFTAQLQGHYKPER